MLPEQAGLHHPKKDFRMNNVIGRPVTPGIDRRNVAGVTEGNIAHCEGFC